MLIYGEDDTVANWVADQIPHVSDFGLCAAIGVESCGRLIAGVVYHDWQPESHTIQISMAATHPIWAKRKNISELLGYPFNQLGAYKVWTMTPLDTGKMALRVNEHIGFRQEAVLAHQFGPKRHAVVCRFLRPIRSTSGLRMAP